MDTVVIYPGRFHPFHKGHKSVYDALVKRFGKDRVFIATSNKVDPPKSPFTFDEKRAMMQLTGIDPSRVVQVKNPYQATEITDNYDPQNTIALFAVSEKDMATDPRFSFKPKKDGSPSYYQPAQKDMKGFEEHGYIVTVPTLDFKVLGEPMRSASEFRANFARADADTQQKMITDLFGAYDERIHKTMSTKIVERLQRADEILEQLIEMGADDKYIVEACARVDMLSQEIIREQSKQRLEQAIMEGGHSLPEEITDFNQEDPMNSVIAIRGIGTMSISSALEKVSEMALDIAQLGAMKDAKDVQDNMPRYMSLLAAYNDSIQEAYRELAQQRKRGGTASKGIDKDITESDYKTAAGAQAFIPHLIKNAEAMIKSGAPASVANKYLQRRAGIFSDAGVKIPDMRRTVIKPVGEHCGDPMADDHKPVRMLLMKLYKKEMECTPGSPEHFEVMQMIDGCRKNIGLDESLEEAWSQAYKDSINCNNPKGFSQVAHCKGRKS